MTTNSRKQLLAPALIAATLGLGLFGYATRIEPNWIATTEYAIGRPSHPITIAHLTDFHVDDHAGLARVRDAAAQIQQRHPDLIVVTGDFFTNHLKLRSGYLEVLKQIRSIAPTFAIAGNHDGGYWARQRGGYESTKEISDLLAEAGIVFLENQRDSLTLKNRTIEIYGAGDLWAGNCLRDTIPLFTSQPNALKILLTHNPDSKFKFADSPWDLMLCGHTHGGQLELPLLGTPFAPVQNKKYVRGSFREEHGTLVVSSGIGCLHGIRFNVRPEIVLVRI